MTEQRMDDGAGLRIAMGAAAGGATPFANASTGFGTMRDPTTHTGVVNPGRLTDRELAWLYQDGIVGKIVDALPSESADAWMEFTFERQTNYRGYGVTGDALEDYLDSKVEPDDLDQVLNQSSIRALFREQTINARIFRNAYILIGLDDGREYSEPIDTGNIRSIDYLEPLTHLDVMPDGHGRYRLSRGRNDLRGGEVEVPFSGIIHPSRLIKFYGKAKPKVLREYGLDEDYSAIDCVFRALSRASQSLDALNYYIQTASVFDYGLDGFSDVREESEETAMAKRMQTIMMSLSALKIFMRDSERESMSTVTRNFGGVGDAIDRITDSICYYTDIPRHVIFGTSNQRGIGNQGKEGIEERQWDDLKIAWRSRHWVPPYLYLGKLACLAKDSPTGGRLPKGLGVDVPSGLKRSDADKVTTLKSFAESMAILLDREVLSPLEVRQAFAGNDVTFTLTLDERISEQVEDAALMVDDVEEDDEEEEIALDGNSPNDPELWSRCLSKAKSKFKIHPSAYSNSWAAKEYKRLGGTWRTDEDKGDRTDDLRKWHGEQWVNLATGEECGSTAGEKGRGKPKCLPKNKAKSLSEAEKKKLVNRKRRKDPKAERSGSPVHVASDAWDDFTDEFHLDEIDPDWNRNDGGWLVWFGGRRTPIAVAASSRSEAISKARKRKRRGGDNVVSARQPNESERKTAANGGWIRTGANGEKPGQSKLRGYGPRPKSHHDADDDELEDAEWDAIAVVGDGEIDEALAEI
jgi:hypothetical protein